MRKILGLIVALFCSSLSACGGAPLKPDPSTPASDSHYPTAEFQACGQRWHGLGVCDIQAQDDLSKVNLQVQGYLSGDLRVYAVSDSSDCQFDQHMTYVKNQLVPIPLPHVS